MKKTQGPSFFETMKNWIGKIRRKRKGFELFKFGQFEKMTIQDYKKIRNAFTTGKD